MAEWLEQASQWHEMYCHDLEVMSSNPGRVELGVRIRSTSVISRTWTKITIESKTCIKKIVLGNDVIFSDHAMKLKKR